MSALRTDVADLLTHSGAHRPLRVVAAIDDLGSAVAHVADPVELDLVLERIPDGIVVRGVVHAQWRSECGTCLRDLAADLHVDVAELYEHTPVEGETYPIEGHEIDLELLVRDAVLLELPLAPTCAMLGVAGCEPPPGLDEEPDSYDAPEPPVDPRWAALSELDL